MNKESLIYKKCIFYFIIFKKVKKTINVQEACNKVGENN